MRALLELRLRESFQSQDQLSNSIIEYYTKAMSESKVREIIASVLPGLLSARQQEMQSWPAVTDCDRLDAAFEDLNSRGIMARHNWSCCGNCGASEIYEEFERLGHKWNGIAIVGYAFYHQQDTEGAASGGGLFLSYGSTQECESREQWEATSLAIGRQICQALRERGLDTSWDGSFKKRIQVSMDWKRRASPAQFVG